MDVDNRYIIGFDMDGVIVDQTYQKVKIAKKFGYDFKPEETATEIMERTMPEDQYKALRETLYNDPEFALEAHLMEGISSVFEFLKSKEYPFYLISRRRDPDMAIKLLRKLELWPHTLNEINSYFVSSPQAKDIRAAQLGITHYIDDELKIINALHSVQNKFLFDKFNVFPEQPYYKKIKSWYDFEKIIFTL